ncbi:MAG: uracil phosphoribosyltransferase [Planctomycetota bacterium]|nr:uracil phosphoribosyltransferase [Planctomycetota bacterium]
MTSTKILDHPLVDCHLTVLRNKSTRPAEFRQSLRRLSMLLAYSATAEMKTSEYPIETPIQKMHGRQLTERVGLVPILRAGIAMVEPMLDLIPTAEVWHLGLYRDEATATPVHYYSKLPSGSPVELAFVLDPMLATGGSACLAFETLLEWGVQQIKMLAIIAAPEGIDRIQRKFPQVEIHCCVVDKNLDAQKYIVPGLGDAGDRMFNTTG